MFTFVSGNLALDFAGTLKGRTSYRQELLPTPAALADWLVSAQVLDTAPDCDDRTLARAVRLREACYRMALATARGAVVAAADRTVVNEFGDTAPPTLTLRADGSLRRTGSADAALAAVARAAAELLGGPERVLIKECGRTECTRLYLDTSRGNSRRWCDMTRCGNRAKSAAFRARSRD